MCKHSIPLLGVLLVLGTHFFKLLIEVPVMQPPSIKQQPNYSHALVDHPTLRIEQEQSEEIIKISN
jgi:hypothetical protein